MRFAITPEQRDFFHKNQFIEFEGLLSPEQMCAIDQEAQEVISHRLKVPFSKWDTLPLHALYKASYDLWRDAAQVKKATHKLSIAHIASEIFDTSPLRIAFDQLCMSGSSCPFQNNLSLIEISSIKPLAGGILFLLSDICVHDRKNVEFPLPQAAGNALFFGPAFPIPWTQLFVMPHFSFLLVAFAPEKSFYRQESNDPYSPLFKKRGYVFNDHLKESFHPIVFGKK